VSRIQRDPNLDFVHWFRKHRKIGAKSTMHLKLCDAPKVQKTP
jgi:hypothetical protein